MRETERELELELKNFREFHAVNRQRKRTCFPSKRHRKHSDIVTLRRPAVSAYSGAAQTGTENVQTNKQDERKKEACTEQPPIADPASLC